MKKTLSLVSKAGALLLAMPFTVASLPAQTAEVGASNPDQSESKDWRFSFAPYLWMVNVSGDMGLPGTGSIPVDVPFSTLKDSINFGFAGIVTAEYKRFGVENHRFSVCF